MTTLAELRQASLKEQRQKEQTQTEAAPSTPAPVPIAPARAEAASVAPAPAVNGNGHHAPAPAAPVLLAPPSAPAPAPDPQAERQARFFARVHETLSHKTLHPSGAKVSADMSPALFHRAKRYCLDHGNITMRQVLIDLLSAYLDEEGY